MKRKNLKTKKIKTDAAGEVTYQEQEETKIQIELHDETYRQINSISFKKNFTELMTHYKSGDSSSR